MTFPGDIKDDLIIGKAKIVKGTGRRIAAKGLPPVGIPKDERLT